MNTLWGWGRASWAGCGPDVRRGGQTLIMGYSADKSPLIGHLAGPLRRLEPLVAQRQEKCGPNRPTPTGYSCNNAVEDQRAIGITARQRRDQPPIGCESCSAPGFLDSGLKVITSTLLRPARRDRVAPGLDFDSRTSPASTARCTFASTRARRGGAPRSSQRFAPTRRFPSACG